MPFLKRRIRPNIVKKRVGRLYRRVFFLQVLWISLIIGVGIGLLGQTVPAKAETESELEYRIKAAFLLNFCKFVSWPDTVQNKIDSPLILCVVGEVPWKSSLESLAGKMVWGHPLEIRFASNTEAITPCHLLFVGKSLQKESAAILASVKSKPVLTVGDIEDFARQGGIIAFVKIDKKIQFEINQKAAETAGLKISSQLLKLAIIADDARAKEN